MSVRMLKVSTFFDRENNRQLQMVEGSCNSADTKPTQDIATGSIMTEADTGKVYFFDEKTSTWVYQFSYQTGE